MIALTEPGYCIHMAHNTIDQRSQEIRLTESTHKRVQQGFGEVGDVGEGQRQDKQKYCVPLFPEHLVGRQQGQQVQVPAGQTHRALDVGRRQI